jgi:hypothetical protein
MIHLYFEEHFNSATELAKVVVHWGSDSDRFVSSRGRESLAGPEEGAFTWSNGVKALCELILKAKFDGDISHPATISGPKGSSASSLDYAIAKQPRWVLDMFGEDINGISRIRRLIKRHNPEGKRPGPIILSWNHAACPQDIITVYLNNQQVVSPKELSSLINIHGLTKAIPNSVEELETEPLAASIPPLPIFNLGDAVINNIHAKSITTKEIQNSLLAQDVKCSDSELKAEIDNLVKLGILKSKKQNLEFTSEFTKKRTNILDFLNTIKERYRTGTNHNGNGQTPRSIPTKSNSTCLIKFQSLSEMDSFLDRLMIELALLFKDEHRILWHIRSPWLPLLKPGSVCRDITNHPILKSAKLITTGSSPTKEWVKEFYKKLGIESLTFAEPILDTDFWVNGEVVVFYGVPKEITLAAHSFLDSCEDVAKFDSIKFYKDILQAPCESFIHIAVAPGLAQELYTRANG